MIRAKLFRPLVIVPFVVLVAGAAVWLGIRSGSSSASNTPSATEQLFTVSPTTLSETVSASGTVAPADTEDLSFAVGGTVETVPVKAGQSVTKGQVLATLGSATLASAVAQAQATLDAAQATLSDDETAGASSAQIANDQAQLTTAYAALLSATSDLSGAALTSPIAGTVATVNLTAGEVLSSSGATGTNLTGTGTGSGRNTAASSSSSSASSSAGASSAANNSAGSAQIEVISSSYVVNLSVDTTTVGNLKVGQSATVTPTTSSSTSTSSGTGGFGRFAGGAGAFTGFGGGAPTANGAPNTNDATGSTPTPAATAASATGTVSSVGTIASASSGVATFPVVVTVDGTPSGFHAGATASAVITYHSIPNALAVPAAAITRSNGSPAVTVSVNGAKSTRAVTTGITSDGEIQITGGLSSGDQVVVTIPTRRATGTGTGTGTGGSFRGFTGGGRFGGGGGG